MGLRPALMILFSLDLISKDCFQMRFYSQVLGVRTSTYFFEGGGTIESIIGSNIIFTLDPAKVVKEEGNYASFL